jgi:capsular polysaccharide biosynthesis protein
MAVQIETQGQLQEFLGVLKRRKWQVLLPASIVLALGIAAAVIVPKKYVARTQIELRPVGVSISTKEGSSAIFQLRSSIRIQRILKDHQNAEFLALPSDQQSDFIKRVQSDIKVTPGAGATAGSSFVTIEYMDVSRDWALDFLRALRGDWINDVLKRDLTKAEDELDKIYTEKHKLELALHEEETALSDLKRENNLSATQPPPGSGSTRNEDPVYEQLTRARSESAALLIDVAAMQGQLETLKAQYDAMPEMQRKENVVEGASNDAALEAIDKQIEDVQAKLKNLKPAAKLYQKYNRDLQQLFDQREEARARKTRSTLEVSLVPNPDRVPRKLEIDKMEIALVDKKTRAEKLKVDIQGLQARLEDLQDVYRNLNETEGRAGRLKASLEVAEKRYNDQQVQVRILSSPESNPFQITEEVNAGTKPTEPNPWLIVSFALVLGLGLGLAVALVAEFSRNCFRSVADISRVMVVPVLGSIGTILTERERRLMRTRRTVVGLSSVCLVGAILFVTWAWAGHAHFLSQDLRDAIEHLRSKLR